MKIIHFEDSNTLYIQLRNNLIDRTESFNDNILFDFDESGQFIGLTIENTNISNDEISFSYKKIKE